MGLGGGKLQVKIVMIIAIDGTTSISLSAPFHAPFFCCESLYTISRMPTVSAIGTVTSIISPTFYSNLFAYRFALS